MSHSPKTPFALPHFATEPFRYAGSFGAAILCALSDDGLLRARYWRRSPAPDVITSIFCRPA